MMKAENRLRSLIVALYPNADADEIMYKINVIASTYNLRESCPLKMNYSEEEVILITYADIIKKDEEVPLQSLEKFLLSYVGKSISVLHVLPFFPYSSDDGFSVKYYYNVSGDLGTWDDLESLSRNYKLMYDAVINHTSSKGKIFEEFLQGKKEYNNFFIQKDCDFDYSNVVRPRTSPLFSRFNNIELWTTFSSDQIDFNFKNPNVLLKAIDILLFYISRGASILRLDAASYLWKESGTSCSCLRGCHQIIELIRTILDIYAPSVSLVTETNVPHRENVKFLSTKEAQMVYQFGLSPIVALSFIKQDSLVFKKWASKLSYKDGTTYLNFLSSHDGIGMVPLDGIASEKDKRILCDICIKRGGEISYKSVESKQIPYELNITYRSLLEDPENSNNVNNARFISSIALLLALKGVPAIYYIILLADGNNEAWKVDTGNKRTINRRRYKVEEASKLIKGKTPQQILRLLNERKKHSAFSPTAGQDVIDTPKEIIAIRRVSLDEEIIAVINLSDKEIQLKENITSYQVIATAGYRKEKKIVLFPCSFVWLRRSL